MVGVPRLWSWSGPISRSGCPPSAANRRMSHGPSKKLKNNAVSAAAAVRKVM